MTGPAQYTVSCRNIEHKTLTDCTTKKREGDPTKNCQHIQTPGLKDRRWQQSGRPCWPKDSVRIHQFIERDNRSPNIHFERCLASSDLQYRSNHTVEDPRRLNLGRLVERRGSHVHDHGAEYSSGWRGRTSHHWGEGTLLRPPLHVRPLPQACQLRLLD